jgi:hypothetical protein
VDNIRGLRDPQKRWVMHFDMQYDEQNTIPVLLCYEPELKERLDQIQPLFTEMGALDVSSWWEHNPDAAGTVSINVIITRPGSEEPVLGFVISLPQAEWEQASKHAATFGRDNVVFSVTANQAVLVLEDDETSWEAIIPREESLVFRHTRQTPDLP